MTVIAMPGSGAMTAEQRRVFEATDAALVATIDAAKNAGVPQGLIVALLHGHAFQQTAAMMTSG
jgi:hypothetical protein